jgi:hypothetical protein
MRLERIKTNFTLVHFRDLSIYFSYETPIAFHSDVGSYVRENDWGPTTGKHLNYVDGGDKKKRVSGERFMELLNEQLNGENKISCDHCGSKNLAIFEDEKKKICSECNETTWG